VTTLRQAVEAMAGIQQDMAETAVTALSDSSAKARLLAMRRYYATHVIAVSEAIDRDAGLRADPELAHEFRGRFSQIRTLVAFHQAKWPVVLLDEAGQEFHDSARAVIEGNRNFVTWALSVLK
jgi:hypothetical protein